MAGRLGHAREPRAEPPRVSMVERGENQLLFLAFERFQCFKGGDVIHGASSKRLMG
ncbi:hypothetical protein AHiyo1_22830 [Arthrobacter sp. Hiyo1]|nr:hypothetical protein AHiyo1_22830 [Arthrobacter sp. Hiyo1]